LFLNLNQWQLKINTNPSTDKTGRSTMSPKPVIRGFDPEDQKWFSAKNLKKLGIVQEEIQWLLDRGYPINPVLDFVGNHHQLSSRQRIALFRATASQCQYNQRAAHMLPLTAAKDGELFIDGFNLIITLEVALSGGLLILGNDGVLRDLAGLRGTYQLIEQTDEALKLLGEFLDQLKVPKATFYLDAPVSNSGRLRQKILAHAVNWSFPIEVKLVPSADPVLSQMERVVSGDSIILDHCRSWFNLSKAIIDAGIMEPWVVNFSEHRLLSHPSEQLAD
jgi:hypothetical protein